MFNRARIALVLLFATTMLAQSFNGKITGRVLDPSASVIPGAKLTLHSTETGAERTTVSRSDGEYEFSEVPPGEYKLTCSGAGFAESSVIVRVAVARSTRADIELTIGKVAQDVEVQESGVSVQTESAQLGDVVNQKKMAELPTVTRSPYDFVSISAGAVPAQDRRALSLSVNGQRVASSNFVLDGGENNDTFSTGPAQSVPLDAVREATIITNNYTAEYGRNVGFVTNVVTKGGTNATHGTAYAFNRNSVLAANSYDNNANHLARPHFNRNQFGGSVGGPILKDKLFHFESFEPIIVRSAGAATFNVPTPQLLAISSPATKALFQDYPLPSDISSTNVVTRTLCPFGTTCNTSTGQGLVTIPAYGLVSRVGPKDFGAGTPQNTYLATGRIDYTLSPKTQIFGRYAVQWGDLFAAITQPYSPALNQPTVQHNQNILFDIRRIWSPTFVTESRAVYGRVLTALPLTPNIDPPRAAYQFTSDPVILPRGRNQSGGPQNLYQFFESATLQRHSHSLQFGGQYIHLRDNRSVGFFQVATVAFFDIQSFVNGVANAYTVALNPQGKMPGQTINPPFTAPNYGRHYHYNDFALFVQDTWRLTPRLTLTPGLRWEYFGVPHSAGREAALDGNFYYGSGSTIFQRIASGADFPTQSAPGKYKGTYYAPDYNNFGPRLGLAFDPFGRGKTVFRSGIGVFYDRSFGEAFFATALNPPGIATIALSNVTLTPQAIANQYAVFPTGPLVLGQTSGRMQDPDRRTAYTVTWNGSLESQLGSNVVVSATYVGASGNKLYTNTDINRLGSAQFLDPACLATNSCGRLNPNYSNINDTQNLGHSTYHGLQLKADTKELSRVGLLLGVNYTWSHSIDNRSSYFSDDNVDGPPEGLGFLDPFNPGLDRASSNFDIRHKFLVNFVWDSPFAAHSDNPWRRALLSGWGVSGIASFQTGQPYTLFDQGIQGWTSNDSGRPKLVGSLPASVRTPDAVTPNKFLILPVNATYNSQGVCIAAATPFNSCGLSVNGPFTGVLSRNTFRRPGTQSQNAVLFRNIPIPGRENMRLQLRGEFYNVFNHPNMYVNPSSLNVKNASFRPTTSTTTPGVTAFFADNRQVVVAAKLIF